MGDLWGCDNQMKFLKLYKNETIVWDSGHKFYKDRSKVEAAWRRISVDMNLPVKELKKKKVSLLATFRKLRRQKSESMLTAASPDEVFQPIWFAYEFMEDFLSNRASTSGKQIYKNAAELDNIETVTKTERVSPQNFTLDEEDYFLEESAIADEDSFEKSHLETKNFETSPVPQPLGSPPTLQQPFPIFDNEEVHKKMKETFDLLNSMLSKKREEDECDLYGKLLAKKIRRYNEEDRYKLMFEIDQLIHSKPP